MTTRLRTALVALAVPTLVAGTPSGYQVRIPLSIGAGSPVQRLAVPGAALAATRTPGLVDLRIFDARGRAVPIARRPAPPPAPRSIALKAMPILGSAGALKVEGVSLRVDAGGQARIARVDGTVAETGRPVVLGTLFDARQVTGEARTLTLDAVVPASQPVTFTVEASRDLATWRKLGEKVIYWAAHGDGGMDLAIPLGMALVGGDYLRVTWQLGSRPLSPVGVRGAVLVSRPGGGAALTEVGARLPPRAGPHAIEVALPFATPIAAIGIVPRGDDLIVPVRVLGRDDPEQPWTPMGRGVAARGGGTSAIALTGGAFRTLRIEADPRTPGFTTTPDIRIGFEPRELLFLAAGPRPFTLAAGRADDHDPYLPAASLMTQAAGRGVAVAGTATAGSPIVLEEARDERRSVRQALLWAVLLLATALLAELAWFLWRRPIADGAANGER